MKRDRDQRVDSPSLPLFDLPLHDDGRSDDARSEDAPPSEPEPAAAEGEASDESPERASQPAPAPRTALFATDDDAEPPVGGEHEDDGYAAQGRVALVTRISAGMADVLAILFAVAVAAGAAMALGVAVTIEAWPTFALLALSFSFLYTVIPLAFWGQTPGMSWVGLEARADDAEPLTFEQTSLRWLGGLITVLLMGTPVLLALAGGSLADRISRSVTVLADHGPGGDQYR